jgi:hypothetical protein
MNKLIIAGILGLTALSAQAATKTINENEVYVNKAITFVKNQMKDPESTQFKGLALVSRTTKQGVEQTIVTGELNAKNSYGGYVGFYTFNVSIGGNGEPDTFTDLRHLDELVTKYSGRTMYTAPILPNDVVLYKKSN